MAASPIFRVDFHLDFNNESKDIDINLPIRRQNLVKILVKIHPKNNRANISGGASLKINPKSTVKIGVKIHHWPLQPCRQAKPPLTLDLRLF